MVLNAAVQMLKEADELKEKVTKFKSGTSMLQDRSLWSTQEQLQKIYQKLLVLDLDYALDKKVEQDLWNVGFKQQIEALQAISKDKKNPLRSEGQAMLSWVLQAAAGFYLCLLHQICTTFQLDLPFRRRASLLGCVEGWGGGERGSAGGRSAAGGAARYITQHCLVHLGDLARYRHQLRVAITFYRHAVVVCPQSGQPYNQLALVMAARGRRLCALYWHVRSLLVRAPFPPAADNLERALAQHAARAQSEIRESGTGLRRLDSQAYITEFLRVLYYIHTEEELETIDSLIDTLNSSLITLVATGAFESMTLIKMAACVMWARGAGAGRLARGAALACFMTAHAEDILLAVLPAVYVWLQWLTSTGVSSLASSAPALWAALADTLNTLRDVADDNDAYARVPLPEDEELSGFTPLSAAHRPLLFARADHSYSEDAPPPTDSPTEAPSVCLAEEPELQRKVRAHRVIQLGKKLADLKPDSLTYVEEDGKLKFTASVAAAEDLESVRKAAPLADDDELAQAVPVVISEADFREKVREKRAGILKPQGSLERAREERAMATQEDQPEDVSEEKSEDKKEARKSRVNIAMAAIMRKQEEINKQVKFVSPPPTPDSSADSAESKDDKPKVIQPKPMKSLANLPLGRKTGGILSLKDRSAGYPHLVNSEPDRKPDKDDKKDAKPAPPPPYKPREREPAPWTPPPQPFNEPRMSFQKPYGPGAGLAYGPGYQPAGGIRLPVVNPKEIDVRTAALQKQNSRQDMFPDGHKLNHNYQVSGDKKNFLNDLPPRFANQYRYWAGADAHYDNKFRDDSPKSPGAFAPRWLPADNYQQPPWWKPDAPSPNFNYTTPPLVQQPNYFTPLNSNIGNPYPNMQYSNMNVQNKGEMSQPYHPSTIGQPMQTLQNLVSSPNFNSPLNSFGSYPSVPYDSAMYPQFNKLGYQGLQPGFPGKELMDMGSFGAADMQRGMHCDPGGNSMDQAKNMEGPSESSNTYSLFSGAPAGSSWGSPQNHPQQSLWSGPGPSPLERLLEQQKQMKPPSQ